MNNECYPCYNNKSASSALGLWGLLEALLPPGAPFRRSPLYNWRDWRAKQNLQNSLVNDEGQVRFNAELCRFITGRRPEGTESTDLQQQMSWLSGSTTHCCICQGAAATGGRTAGTVGHGGTCRRSFKIWGHRWRLSSHGRLPYAGGCVNVWVGFDSW